MNIRYSFLEITRGKKPSDSWWSIVFINPLSYVLIYFFANYFRVRHELITALSLILGLFAAVFYYLGDRLDLAVAATLFLLSVVFDSVDGKLAKLTQTRSRFGRILDVARDKIVQVACVLGLALGQTRASGDLDFILLGGLYLFFSFANLLISHQMSGSWSSSKALEKLQPIRIFGQSAYPIPTVAEWTFLLFVFFPVLGNVKLGFYSALSMVGFSIIFLGKEFLSIKRAVRKSI